jgi:hypothetical protein
VVVSDEEDLDEDENMEAFKNLFDKRVFRVYRIRNFSFLKRYRYRYQTFKVFALRYSKIVLVMCKRL